MRRIKALGAPAAALLLCCAGLVGFKAVAQEQARPSGSESKVGVSQNLRDVVLPGTQLEVREVDLDTPVIARIVGSFPHGSDTRYEFAWYGLEPGDFDLGDFLKRRDGSSTQDLPPIPIEVHSVLDPSRLLPNPVGGKAVPRVGGYRTWLVLGGLAWAFGLWALLNYGRKSGKVGDAAAGAPQSLADRLRPLVESAVAGTLSKKEQAELELKLISLWRRRLDLTGVSAPEALRVMRQHEQAGPLLSGLEDWLHRPSPPEGVDVEQLLLPYSKISSSELVEQDARS